MAGKAASGCGKRHAPAPVGCKATCVFATGLGMLAKARKAKLDVLKAGTPRKSTAADAADDSDAAADMVTGKCRFCDHVGKFKGITGTEGAQCQACDTCVVCLMCGVRQITEKGEDCCDHCLASD